MKFTSNLIMVDPQLIFEPFLDNGESLLDAKFFMDAGLDIFTGKGIEDWGFKEYRWVDASDYGWKVTLYTKDNYYFAPSDITLANVNIFNPKSITTSTGMFVSVLQEDLEAFYPKFFDNVQPDEYLVIHKPYPFHPDYTYESHGTYNKDIINPWFRTTKNLLSLN